jgi:hypothetical protein
MWEPIKKLEEIQQLNDNIFKRIDELFGFGKKANPAGAGVNSNEELKKDCERMGGKYSPIFQSGIRETTATINGNKVEVFKTALAKQLLYCYDWEKDEHKINFLAKGKYEATEINISKNWEVDFWGNWHNGTFRGIMNEGSVIDGGMFAGLYYSENSGFKISPSDFYGAWGADDGILGMNYLKEGDNIQKTYLFQIPEGQYLVLTGNSGKKVILKIVKSINSKGPNIIVQDVQTKKQIEIKWLEVKDNIDDSILISIGEPFIIEGLSEIKDAVKKIDIFKKIEEEGVPTQTANTGNRFIINEPGFKINVGVSFPIKGHQEKFNQMAEAINNRVFMSNLEFLKREIESGEIDGYGNYPALSYLFPEKGTSSLSISNDAKNVMQFFVDLKKYSIDNFVKKIENKGKVQNVKHQDAINNFINRLKKYLNIDMLKPKQTEPTTEPIKKSSKVISPTKK